MIRIRPLIAIALGLVLLLPAAAVAGPVREYQLQYEPTGDVNGALMIVSALVDPQLQLPVTISVPAPRGSTLLWAGEILGGDPAQDPSRTPTVEQVGEMDVYTFTVEQSHTAQLELQLPAPSVSGPTVSASVDWTNPGDAVLVTGAVIVEAGAQDVTTEPGLTGGVQTNDAGQSLYPLGGIQLENGGTYAIAVEWTRTQGGTGGGGSATESSPILWIALLALVVAVVALVIVVTRERTKARRSEGVTEADGSRSTSTPASLSDSDDEMTWS